MRRLSASVLLVACAPPPKPAAGTIVPPTTDAAVAEAQPSGVAKAEPTYVATSAAQVGAVDDHVWPPPRMAVSGAGAAGEGEWVAWQRPWLHTLEGAPPTFYTGFVRPDDKRPAKVEVVAMDARQLELDMAIGVEGPFPPDEKTAGKWPRSGGKLPRDAAVATRVVAAWNGGFRFDQGKWGMSIRRREFMPPVADVASLLMYDDGRLGFGTWGPSMATPPGVRSLRQNLDPLVDDGVVDPRHRPKWGGILGGGKKGQQAKRAGLCRTKGGHLMYLWGNDLEPRDLGEGMKRAGCDYGMHLDMNLYHVGFVFMSWDDAKYEKGKSEALSMAMGVAHTRYVHAPSPKEFFYATLRAPGPSGFSADGGAQPAPTWSPAVTARAVGPVRVTRFDAGRVRLAMVGGHLERDAKGAPLYLGAAPAPLAGDDLGRVLAAIRLDLAKEPLGLLLDGAARRPLGGKHPLVAVDAAGRLSLVPAGEGSTAPHQLETEPVILAGAPAGTLPAVLDVAFGLDAQGNLLVADKTGPATPAALVDALVQAGCRVAVAPRGDKARFLRAGRDTIYAGGTDTRLYVLARRPDPATFRFDLDEQGAPRWPKVKTPLP